MRGGGQCLTVVGLGQLGHFFTLWFGFSLKVEPLRIHSLPCLMSQKCLQRETNLVE